MPNFLFIYLFFLSDIATQLPHIGTESQFLTYTVLLSVSAVAVGPLLLLHHLHVRIPGVGRLVRPRLLLFWRRVICAVTLRTTPTQSYTCDNGIIHVITRFINGSQAEILAN